MLSVFFLYVLLYSLELHQEVRERFRASKTDFSPLISFPSDRSKAVPLFLLLFVCASVV